MKHSTEAESYANQLSVQMRKGVLAYCVLVVCDGEAVYSSDVIRRLHLAELVVAEGTIYPLLSRLQRDGLLAHQWQESEQGPPRKYYRITPYGQEIRAALQEQLGALNKTLTKLEKGTI